MKFKTLILIFLFTLLSVVVRGYEFGLGNQEHYLVYLNYYQHLFLYSRDYLLQTHQIPYTIFVSALNFLPLQSSDFQITVFGIYFLLLFVFYFSIYRLVLALFSSRSLAWIALFLLIIPIPIGGSSIATLEKQLNPRFVGEVALVLSLYLVSIKKLYASSFIAGLGFLFHPLTLIPFPGIFLIYAYLTRTPAKKIIGPLSVFIITSSPILSKYLSAQSGATFFMDRDWRSVIDERLSYIFALRWSILDWLLTLSIPAFFLGYSFFKKIPPLVLSGLIVGLALFIVNIISDLLSLRVGLQLQLTRNLYIVIVFCLFYVAQLLDLAFRSVSAKYYLLGGLLVLDILVCFPGRLTDGLLWQRPLSDYEKSAVWAGQHTPQDSLFLVPEETTGFRLWSSRSVVVERKEGGDSLYDRNLALTWDSREDLLEDNYYQMDANRLSSLERQFHFNYFVTTQSLPLPLANKQGDWKIYLIK